MARAALALWIVVVVAAPARADAPTPKEAPRLTPREAFVVGDVSAAFFIGLGFTVEYALWDCECDTAGGGPFWMPATMIYLTFGPYVHVQAGHPGRAVLSAVARVGLPVAGLALARSRDWHVGPTLLIAGGGIASAMLLDWFVLARVDADDYSHVTGYVVPMSGGAIAGLAGVW